MLQGSSIPLACCATMPAEFNVFTSLYRTVATRALVTFDSRAVTATVAMHSA